MASKLLRNFKNIISNAYRIALYIHSIIKKGQRKTEKNTLGISSNTHIFQKTYPLTIFSSRGEYISMISLLSVTFNSEIPARNSNISQGLFYIPVIISTFEIQKFRTFQCVCSFSPFFFSFVCSTHFFQKKRKENVEKKFLGFLSKSISRPTVVFSSENAWTVQTYT